MDFRFIKFTGKVYFRATIFNGKVDFRETTFNEEVYFNEEIYFGETIFNEEVYFSETIFNNKILLEGRAFKGKVNFDLKKNISTNIDITFKEIEFFNTNIFKDIKGKISFHNILFDNNANIKIINNSQLEVSFEDCYFDKSQIICRDCEMSKVKLLNGNYNGFIFENCKWEKSKPKDELKNFKKIFIVCLFIPYLGILIYIIFKIIYKIFLFEVNSIDIKELEKKN